MGIQFKALRELKEDEKLAPQARTIMITLIKMAGLNKLVDKEKLEAQLKEDDSLHTRQPEARVIGYYQPKLVEAGLIEVVKPVREAKSTDGKDGEKATPKKAAPKKAATA